MILDAFLHATRDEQISIIGCLDAATAQTLWAELVDYVAGAENQAEVRGLTWHRRRQIFRHLIETEDEAGFCSRKAVARYFGIDESHLREISDEGIACDWPPLDAPKPDIAPEIVTRLLERINPAEHADANQDQELAEALRPEALAAIRAERDRYLYETPDQREARFRAADVEAMRLADAAAAMIMPLKLVSAKQLQVILRARSDDELQALQTAVQRCIDYIEDTSELDEEVNTAELKELRKLIRTHVQKRIHP
jgi:hypothetical protein